MKTTGMESLPQFATLANAIASQMPVATPPNAIVFGSNRLSIAEMARAGIILNLCAVLVIASVVYLLGLAVFGIDPTVVPEWAKSLVEGVAD